MHPRCLPSRRCSRRRSRDRGIAKYPRLDVLADTERLSILGGNEHEVSATGKIPDTTTNQERTIDSSSPNGD
jgi:hypothetical protein